MVQACLGFEAGLVAELQRENRLLTQGRPHGHDDQDALAAFAHQLRQAQQELSESRHKGERLERDLKRANQEYLDKEASSAQEITDANKSAALWKQAAESAEETMKQLTGEMEAIQESCERWKEAAEASDISLQQLAIEMAAAYEQCEARVCVVGVSGCE